MILDDILKYVDLDKYEILKNDILLIGYENKYMWIYYKTNIGISVRHVENINKFHQDEAIYRFCQDETIYINEKYKSTNTYTKNGYYIKALVSYKEEFICKSQLIHEVNDYELDNRDLNFEIIDKL